MSITDSLSKRGAAFLAAQLDAWWHATGALHVKHWIEPNGSDRTSAGDDDGHTIWAVRSNLVRGNPPPPACSRTTPPACSRTTPPACSRTTPPERT